MMKTLFAIVLGFAFAPALIAVVGVLVWTSIYFEFVKIDIAIGIMLGTAVVVAIFMKAVL